MAKFPNPSGGSMTVANEAEARERGWTPSMGTFGVNSYADSGGDGGSGGGSGGESEADRKARLAEDVKRGFAATSGVTEQDLAERKRQFDLMQAERERQWTREGQPRLQIDQRLAMLREQEINTQREMVQGNLALQFITQAAQMGGPGDVFQMQDLLRGARTQGGLPTWLQALRRNAPLDAFAGPGSETPIPQSASLLAEQLAPGVTIGATPAAAAAGVPAAAPGVPLVASAAAAPFAEGALLKSPGVPGIYVFRAGRIVRLATWDDYKAAGGHDDERTVQTIDAGTFNTWSNPPAPAPAAAAPVAAPTSPLPPGYVAPQLAPTAAGLGTSPAGYNYNQALAGIGDVFRRGATGVAPGVLESMDDAEVQSMASGGRALGYDVPAWMRAWQKSRIGQTASSPSY